MLLLLAYEPTFPEGKIIVSEVDAALQQQSSRPVALSVEYMNADLGASQDIYQSMAQLIHVRQQQNGPYDLVITAGNNALTFALNQGRTLFADAPVTFINVTDSNLLNYVPKDRNISGVLGVPPIYDFLAFARFIYPNFDTLYVITGTLPERADRLALVQQAGKHLNIQIKNLSLKELSWEQLKETLSRIHNKPVLLLSAYRDHLGQEKHSKEGLAYLTSNSGSPIWQMSQAGIGLGIAGGVVNDLGESAKLAVSLALQQLAAPHQPPAIHWQPPLLTLVDAHQLQKYGISFSTLPANVRIINLPDSFWQRYRWVGVLVIFLSTLALILAGSTGRLYQSLRRTLHDMQQRRRIAQSLLDASPHIIFYKDLNGRYELFNQKFTQITLGNPAGQTDYELFPREIASQFRAKDQEAITKGEECVNEEWVLNNQNQHRLFETHKAPIYDEQQRPVGVLGMSIDITYQRELEERVNELEHLIHVDALTKLPNKKSLFEQLSKLLAQTDEHQLLAVAYLDLDKFKDINDTLGHDIGDELLRAVAQRLTSNIQEHDLCARWGGDEFILVLHVDDFNAAQEKCDQLIQLISRPYSLNGHLISIYASIGLCLYPHDGSDGETLIRNADASLHKAKEQGRNRAVRYHSDFTDQIQARLMLEQDLHSAMENRQFILLYQPQFSADGLNLHGVEALVRWQHPTRGIISPSDFISLTESSGMIVELGYWILRSACQQFLFWKEQGLMLNKIAVNVSPVQFTATFAIRVADILSSIHFDPHWLELEVTEGLMMSDTVDVAEQIQMLRNLGIHFSVDDFGTGYSSLNKLKTMPVSTLKIDQSFIRNLALDNSDYKIVHAIIQMAHSLNLSTVAEGVESIEHEQILQQLGCNLLQGFFYAKPMEAAEFFDRYH